MNTEHYNKLLRYSGIKKDRTYTNEQVNELRDALQGILDIGKRNMENPKCDPYFKTAKEVIKKFY